MNSNGVHIGRDGWLFLIGGSNDVGDLFSASTDGPQIENSVWMALLAERERQLALLGVQYFHIWVPDKLAVYPECVDHDLVLNKASPASALIRECCDGGQSHVVIDLLPALLREKADRLLYWKTDTHWTYHGACVAYEVICNAIGATARTELRERPCQTIELTLDLGSKLSPPVKEHWSMAKVLSSSKIIYKNEIVLFLEMLAPKHQGDMHTGASVVYENTSPTCDPRKLLIFGDSYCEYRPHSLAALLGETFRYVQFVWSSSIDYDLVKSFKPDIVLSEMAERFIRRMPNDSFDLTQLVYSKIVAFMNRNCTTAESPKFFWKKI